MAKVPRIIKVPEGEAWVSTENPLGEMGYYVVSKGDLGPFRVKIRSASFNNISIAPWVLKGVYVPDIITILASPLLHPRRHRPVMSMLAVEIPYWGQSLLRVLGGIVAVLLPAGTHRLRVPVQDDVVHAEPSRPDGSRAVRLDAAPRRGRQVAAEGRHHPRERRREDLQDRTDHRAACRRSCWSSSCRSDPTRTFTNFQAGVFYALAIGSVSVIGILVAGWSSANKYSLLGGLRAGGQLIAYELPMVLAVVGVVIQAGSMNLQQIVVAQNTYEIFGLDWVGMPFVVTQFVGFVIFMIAVQAELTQPPFDMPIAESELVSGYMTEYSGFRFLMFFIGEFATAGVFAFIAVDLVPRRVGRAVQLVRLGRASTTSTTG